MDSTSVGNVKVERRALISYICNHFGRVATGDYSPAAPTDPDLPDSGIRLLRSWNRCTAVNTVNNTRLRERIA